MKVLEYEYNDKIEGDNQGWTFNKVEFKKVNLLVGDTGSGKTKFLNSFFNLGRQVVHKEIDKKGSWNIKFSIGDNTYKLILSIKSDEADDYFISREELYHLENGKENAIIIRDDKKFYYNGKELPKLASNSSGIALLKDEEDLNKIHDGFSTILRRNFSIENHDRYLVPQILPLSVYKKIEKEPDLKRLFHSQLNLNVKLFIAQKFFNKLFTEIKEQYINAFPFISDIRIEDPLEAEYNSSGLLPTFLIKERKVDHWISLQELSSGMQKVLMIIADVLLFPQNGIYLIDEYENSLGVSAINYFPELINNTEKEIQFIITSHHPYIINKIPVENWYIFNRTGSAVTIKYGLELKNKFSKSRQEAFVQLINDDFYIRGVE